MTMLAAQMRARRPPGRHQSCMSRAIFRPPFMHIQEAVQATRQSYWHLHRPHLESLVRHLLKSILRTSEGFVQSIYTEIQGECKNFKGSPLNARSSKMVRRALFAGVAIFFFNAISQPAIFSSLAKGKYCIEGDLYSCSVNINILCIRFIDSNYCFLHGTSFGKTCLKLSRLSSSHNIIKNGIMQ